MASFKVLSDNFALGKQGETVDSELLDGCNISALVEAGHLAEVSLKSKSVSSEQEK